MGLEARNIIKEFGIPPVRALNDVSFKVESGEFVALTGRSGSGKSTLLYLLSSLDLPSAGSVLLSGVDLTKINDKELHQFRNESMGFVFQSHYLLPELTALENVLMPARKTKQEEKRLNFAKDLLEQFGLSHRINNLPRQMSGGEQQRVAIARALIMEPQFLFADEPTGNLDSVNGDIVMKILRRINQERGTTIFMVTHDPDFALMASMRIILSDGCVQKIEKSNA